MDSYIFLSILIFIILFLIIKVIIYLKQFGEYLQEIENNLGDKKNENSKNKKNRDNK